MAEPEIGGEKPVLVILGEGPLFWCACGRSKTQPFCDGSHKGTPFKPLKFIPQPGGEALLCACKRTRTPPYCDGSHNQLQDVYREAGEEEIRASASARFMRRDNGDWGRAELDGGAFVLTPQPWASEQRVGWRMYPLIDRTSGALHLSQYAIEAAPDACPVRFAQSEVVLFLPEAGAEITVSGRTFSAASEEAVCIRPGEAFSMRSNDGERVRAIATVCPSGKGDLLTTMPDNFDAAEPGRTARPDRALRQAMGDRYYQVLIDETKGARCITQFIGEIPRSRAAAHRHLYEEALLVLFGEGWLWTENAKAEVRPGDIIFLPMKQVHSLECTSIGGMRLAGAFYPSGSPAINY